MWIYIYIYIYIRMSFNRFGESIVISSFMSQKTVLLYWPFMTFFTDRWVKIFFSTTSAVYFQFMESFFLLRLICKYVLKKKFRSSQNFIWFAVLIQQKFDDWPLFNCILLCLICSHFEKRQNSHSRKIKKKCHQPIPNNADLTFMKNRWKY